MSVASVNMGYFLQHNCYRWQEKGYLVEVLNIDSFTASEQVMHKY